MKKSSQPEQPSQADRPAPWWLDEPIRPVWGRGQKHGLNPRLAWFTDRLPGRARALILKAAHGDLRAKDPGTSGCLPAVRTLRDFIALPAQTVLLQHHYGYKTHMDLCRAFRDNGVVGPLFLCDETRLLRHYPYLP